MIEIPISNIAGLDPAFANVSSDRRKYLNKKVDFKSRNNCVPNTCKYLFKKIILRLKDAFSGIKKQFNPFIFSLILFFLGSYYNSVIQAVIQNLTIEMGKTKNDALPDLGFYLFPNLSNYTSLPDTYLLAMVIAVLLKTLIRRRISCVLLIVKRYTFIHAILFFLRGTSIAITMLPNPWTQCNIEEFPNVFIGGLMIILGKKRTCFDVLFSGHSAMITLTTLIWIQYETNIIIQLLWIPVATIGYFIMISTRFHYTVDVVYGTLITIVVWSSYHYMARRLRSLAVKRSRYFGDLKVMSPLNEETGVESYTIEEREYILQIEEYKMKLGIFWKIRSLLHSKYSIPRSILTPICIHFLKWFECWNEDLEFEKRIPLLPITVNRNDF